MWTVNAVVKRDHIRNHAALMCDCLTSIRKAKRANHSKDKNENYSEEKQKQTMQKMIWWSGIRLIVCSWFVRENYSNSTTSMVVSLGEIAHCSSALWLSWDVLVHLKIASEIPIAEMNSNSKNQAWKWAIEALTSDSRIFVWETTNCRCVIHLPRIYSNFCESFSMKNTFALYLMDFNSKSKQCKVIEWQSLGMMPRIW